MSACELKRNYDTQFAIFSIESEEDLLNLPSSNSSNSGFKPCCQGSKALCIDGLTYVLNSQGEWVLMQNGSSESNAIHVVRGSTYTAYVTLTSDTGVPYEIDDNDILRFCVKKHPSDSTYAISKEYTASDYDSGHFVIALSPSDTSGLNVGTYYYDIGLQHDSDYYIVVEKSPFVIIQNISEREDG